MVVMRLARALMHYCDVVALLVLAWLVALWSPRLAVGLVALVGLMWLAVQRAGR